MASVTDSVDEDFCWSEDEIQKKNIHSTFSAKVPISSVFAHFAEMGFSPDMILKAMQESGMEKGTQRQYWKLFLHIPFSRSLLKEVATLTLLEILRKVQPTFLTSAVFKNEGPNASLSELQAFIYASQITDSSDSSYTVESHFLKSDEDETGSNSSNDEFPIDKKRKKESEEAGIRKSNVLIRRKKEFEERYQSYDRHNKLKRILVDSEKHSTLSSLPCMVSFGVPDYPNSVTQRNIPGVARGPPYFYYENVAIAPRGAWRTISKFLYEIQPEFVYSKHFSAPARKRGYIHNLPIGNRFPLEPQAPRTIHEALPLSRKWWLPWDHRTQFNCINTCVATALITEKIQIALSYSSDPPPLTIIKYVISQCKRRNLVWVGLNRVAPLEPEEIEMLMGYPKNHTRGGGISSTQRFKSLGNSFQVDTVAYHFYVLKGMFPNGITLLSLFSGIGGAEVALHQLGIPLKTVVSVEISEFNRNILRSWWDQTNQSGTLIEFSDVQELCIDRLKQLISCTGGFDLVVGGIPCNNLSGCNRATRSELEGKHSVLFYDYFRILEMVKKLMGRNI